MSLAEELKRHQKEGLLLLIEWHGSQVMLANRLGVSKQTVNNWVSRGRISAKSAIVAERITGKEFKKEQLRPDVIEWSV